MSTSSKSKTIGKAATPPVQRSAAQPAKDASSVKPATAVPVVQRKLTVGSANDVYEQQADSMADKVVNMTEADVAVKRREGVKNKSPLAVQAKSQPGAFLFRKSNPVLSPKTDEKLQKAANPELKKKADEKLQKAADAELKKKADEKLQKAADAELKKKADEKLQKAADAELKKKADEKLQKAADAELKKKADEKVQKAADAELKKKSEEKQQEIKLEQQKTAFESGQKIKKKSEEKIQQTIQRKNAQEQQRQVSNAQVTQQVHEPKQRSHEVTEKDLRRKPEQKEEEKIKKKDEPLKKKAEEKPQKKSEEKVQQKAAVKVQKQAVVQLVRTITAAPPAPRRTAKEEDKIKKKAEEKPQKKTEEKVQKSAEKTARKDGIHPVSPAAAKPVVARTILPKEDDKLKKKADEKLQKASEEKVQKSSEKGTGKDGIHPVSPVAALIRPKEDEKLKKKPDVQREAAEAASETSVSPAFEAKLGTEMNGGRPLDAGTKGYMEIRFGVDFGQVRIHTDGTAARLCNEIGAQAFAYKNHIFFNSGKYRPDTQSGRFLLAHELTHVIQQGYALHKSADKEKPAISKTAEKKPQRTVTHSGPRVQRLGWDTVNNAVRRVVPVWTLLTVIMGYNPILGESVTRNATAWFNGLLDLIPVVGPSIFDKLQSSGIMARVQQWFDGVFAELPTYNEVNSTWDRCWEAMGIMEGIDGNIAIFRNHFSPLITRIVNFGTKVFNKVVEFLRETLLRPLDNVIKDIPGWELITVLIGTNPLTGERKERTAMNVMRGVVAFIPGGQEKLDQLVQSRALEKAFLWFNTETTARNLTWERIKNTFKSAFDTLQASDILHPIDTFRRLAGIFSPLLRDLVGFAGAALEKLLEFIFETVMGAGGALVLSTLKKVRSTFLLVIRDPVGFLRNLVRGVGQGVQQFGRNILTHLRDGVIAWLTGPIAAAGVQMPERWDLKGFIWFGLQIMGLTWDKIKQRMIAKLGERVVNALETGFEFIMEVREKGIVKALKDRISEFFGGLRDQLLNKIKSFIQEKIVTAGIQQLLALLSPVGAVIDAILKTYNTIMFFIDNIRRILEFVNSVLDSITAIATGNLGQAASFIERTMARTIPILLDFLARFLNLGNVAKKVQDAIKALQDWVGSKVDAVIEWVKNAAARLLQSGRNLAGRVLNWWSMRKTFQGNDNVQHSLYFEKTGNKHALMMASNPVKAKTFINNTKKAISSPPLSTDSSFATKKSELEGTVIPAAELQLTDIETLQSSLDTDDSGTSAQRLTRSTDQNQTKYDTLLTKIDNIIPLFAKMNVKVGEYPPMRLPTYTNNVIPTRATAEYVNKKRITWSSAGTNAGSHAGNLEGWFQLRMAKLTPPYARVHLFTHRLGGQATDSNLVPADDNLVNKKMTAMETDMGKEFAKGSTIWYKAAVTFNHVVNIDPAYMPSHNPATTQKYADSITANWGTYVAKSATSTEYNEVPGTSSVSEGPAAPTFPPPGTVPKPNLYGAGQYKLANALGIGRSARRARDIANALRSIPAAVRSGVNSDATLIAALAAVPFTITSAEATKIDKFINSASADFTY